MFWTVSSLRGFVSFLASATSFTEVSPTSRIFSASLKSAASPEEGREANFHLKEKWSKSSICLHFGCLCMMGKEKLRITLASRGLVSYGHVTACMLTGGRTKCQRDMFFVISDGVCRCSVPGKRRLHVHFLLRGRLCSQEASGPGVMCYMRAYDE